MARDIGGFFERLTKQGRGGRRTDGDASEAGSQPPRRAGSGRSSGRRNDSDKGASDLLGDLVRRGAEAVRTGSATLRDTVAERARPTSDTALPPEGVVTIEYAPQVDGDPDPGEVVWAWVPFEDDPEQGKDRPVVVIGRRGDALVGVPLTTRRNEREAQIELGSGDWDPQRRPSYARIWRMLDLDPSGMRREGAALDRRRFDQVVAAVDRYYDVRR